MRRPTLPLVLCGLLAMVGAPGCGGDPGRGPGGGGGSGAGGDVEETGGD